MPQQVTLVNNKKLTSPVKKVDGTPQFSCFLFDNDQLGCVGTNVDGVFLNDASVPIVSQGQLLEAPPADLGTYDSIIDFCVSTPLGPDSASSLQYSTPPEYGSNGELGVCVVLQVNGSNIVKCWGKFQT
jgi:hypothetical protein